MLSRQVLLLRRSVKADHLDLGELVLGQLAGLRVLAAT